MIPLLLKALPFLKANALVLILLATMTGQHVLFTRSVNLLTEQNRLLKVELASARGTIQELNTAVATMKPGETKIIYVDKPIYIPGATQTIETKVPVFVTRTDTRIETTVKDPIVLPPKEIQTILDRSPQSLIFNLEATRDIAKGEKFRVIATQIAPGVYQPILEVGSPITGTVTTVTPTDRIPQPAPTVYAFQPGWHLGGRMDTRPAGSLDVTYQNIIGNGEYRFYLPFATVNGSPLYQLSWQNRW